MAALRKVARPRSYREDKAYTPIAALGIGIVMFALAVGALAGLYVGDVFAGTAPDPEQSRGVVGAIDAWRRPVAFFGISLLMTSVVVVLRRITQTLRYERDEALKTYLPALLSKGGN